MGQVQDLLIEAGNRVLSENLLPPAGELSLTVSNAETGLNLIRLGIAQKQAKRLTSIQDFLDVAESQLFNPRSLENMSLEERLAVVREAKHSWKTGVDFIKDTRESVDIAKLQVDMVANDARIKKSKNNPENHKIVREKLTDKVINNYQIKKYSEENN